MWPPRHDLRCPIYKASGHVYTTLLGLEMLSCFLCTTLFETARPSTSHARCTLHFLLPASPTCFFLAFSSFFISNKIDLLIYFVFCVTPYPPHTCTLEHKFCESRCFRLFCLLCLPFQNTRQCSKTLFLINKMPAPYAAHILLGTPVVTNRNILCSIWS